MGRTAKGLWLEIIRVQSSRQAGGVAGELIHGLELDPTVRGSKEIRVFSNETGDLAIHILWQSDRMPREGSSIGLRLAAALSEHGLVNHTIWIEEV
jgi:hypothetical protein